MSESIKRQALYAQFPRLDPTNHRITSNPTDDYNCVAWVERDESRWWEPGFFWPRDVPQPQGDDDLECYLSLFECLGYEICASSDLEAGFLKIALYVEGGRFHHVAKQLPSGRWSSKAGPLHDLRHQTLELLEDAVTFARAPASIFMRRPHDGSDTMAVEEGELLLPFS